MFGCISRIISWIMLIAVGAVLHAQWPAIKRQLRERIPELLPAPKVPKARTVVWLEVAADRVIVRGIG